MNFSAVLPLLAKFTFNGDVKIYTLLTVVFGIGSMLGGFFAASRKRTAPHILVDASLIFAFQYFWGRISPNLIIALIFLGNLTGAVSIFLISLGKCNLPTRKCPEMRGRVMSLLGSRIFWLNRNRLARHYWMDLRGITELRWGLAAGGFAAIIAAIIAIPTLKQDKYFKIPPKTVSK